MNQYYVIFLGIWLLVCSIQDVKRKEIHIALLLAGMITSIVLSIFLIDISIESRIIGVFLGGTLIGLHFLSRGQIGIADGLIVSGLGLGLGFSISSAILLLSLFLSAVVSLFLIVLKKVKRKTTIPFVPFLFVAYLGVILFT